MPKTIKEYRVWRKQQRNLPLNELIEKPNCGFDCPEGGSFSCGCAECGAEMIRFKNINPELWDKENGYLGSNGCKLKRKNRPEVCLRHICEGKLLQNIISKR